MTKIAYKLFLIVIPFLLLFGFLNREDTLDINIHDTYYIISCLHTAVLLSLLFGIYAWGYWVIRKSRSSVLNLIVKLHLAITFLGPIVEFGLSQFYRTETMEYEFNLKLSFILWGVVVFVLLGQLLFPVSLIYGMISRKNRTKD